MKLTGTEREQGKRVARKVEEAYQKRSDELLQSYSEEVRQALKLADRYETNAMSHTALGESVMAYLQEPGTKPSDFFRQEMQHMKGWIPDHLLEDFYCSVDAVNKWQWDESCFRRSLRTKRYTVYVPRMFTILNRYHKAGIFGTDLVSLLQGKAAPDIQVAYRYYQSCSYRNDIPAVWIQAELDRGNTELIAILKDILLGENAVNLVSYELIRGIVQSECQELYEAVGQLLLAARLQEGLRQAICDNMDAGTLSAFRYLFNIVVKQDLLRYSSVLRSVGTWTGLLGEEEGKLDRINKKQIALIAAYLEDEEAREAALQSEDSMQIYLALWSYGVQEIEDACAVIEKLTLEGSKHQRMVCCYYLQEMHLNGVYVHQVAKAIVRRFYQEQDTMAAIMRGFMPKCIDYIDEVTDRRRRHKAGYQLKGLTRQYADVEQYFKDRTECEEFYGILQELLQAIPKKQIDFQPCIFPWNKEALRRSDVICRLAVCASALQEEDKITAIAELLPQISTDYFERTSVMLLTLVPPYNEKQREMLIGCMADRTYVGTVACELVSQMELSGKEYLQLEAMLKYKTAEIRKNVLSILYTMGEDGLELCIARLLADRKEEKRTAGLDLLLQLQKDPERKVLYMQCLPLLDQITEPSTKERILIQELQNDTETECTKENGYGLYDVHAEYDPKFDEDFLRECKKTYKDVFGDKKRIRQLPEILAKLDALIEEHKYDEFEEYEGSVHLLTDSFWGLGAGFRHNLPLKELWEDFYDKEIQDYATCLLLSLYLSVLKGDEPHMEAQCRPLVEQLYGREFLQPVTLTWFREVIGVINGLLEEHRDALLLQKCSVAVANELLKSVIPMICGWESTTDKDENGKPKWRERTILTYAPIRLFTEALDMQDGQELFAELFPYQYELADCHSFRKPLDLENNRYFSYIGDSMQFPCVQYYITACTKGIITKDYLYKMIFREEERNETMHRLSYIVQFYQDRNRSLENRRKEGSWVDTNRRYAVQVLLGHPLPEELSEEDEKRLQLAIEVYQKLSGLMMEAELKRGDSETEFSRNIYAVQRISGVSTFVRILSALGKETLERSSWFNSTWNRKETVTKRQSLSHMLQVCIPDIEDDAERLRSLVKDTDIKESRLIEAAFYAPEWIPLVGDYLGWAGFVSGCYYFMAHMKEKFEDKRKAMIARYTPIAISDLNDGAFDVDWFMEVYQQLGEEHFRMLYEAAKYISDGAKHTRARKYADAALGIYKTSELENEIVAKRNKDLVMAYGLIPIQNEKDIRNRYLFLQKFKKEGRQYGAQRRASENRAVELALQNLSINAGYQDVTRLILQMESLEYEERKTCFEPYNIEDITVWLEACEDGKCELVCEKAGKRLKSVPAKYKKNTYIVSLNDNRKQFTEQYRRTRAMFEDSMEKGTEFTFAELKNLLHNPVTERIVANLVGKMGERMGFIWTEGLLCVEEDRTIELADDTLVSIAHPYHLYQAGHWHAYQQYVFDQQIRQPFKQVFRELYVKTEEERNMFHSLRYAGNQIQPARTVGCLKTRHWVADVESGLQKVYYQENIVAQIYALADWFSPADIESPTLEWVVFTDRKTGEEIRIADIPDIIFSEVMRDVDMAVSVAHAGGVDPESSHSTIEMRKAIAEFTMPLFRLQNVRFTDHHAIIEGKLANYRIHLGSGVIHQEGGPMIQVLPVHSQRRGRIYLPFVDEDPKTAEILTKILFFAEDTKIKDPFILEQIG